MTIFKSQKITELEARIDELETANLDLTGQIEAAKQTAETNQAVALSEATETIKTLTEANAEIPSLNATITELTEKIKTLESAAIVTKEKIDNAAAAKLAAMGHGEPLNLGKTSATEEKQDFSNLTGIAKVTALFKSQNVFKNSPKSN